MRAANFPIMNVSSSLIGSRRSRIADALMLGLEERRQQAIDAQQSRAGECNAVTVDREEIVGGVFLPYLAPVVDDLDTELVAEVAGVELAGLQVQDQLAHQQLMLC